MKVKHIVANLYSVLWVCDEKEGRFRQTFRVLAMNAQDAIDGTKSELRSNSSAQVAAVEMLSESIHLRVSDAIFNYLGSIGSSDNHPYTNEDFRKMLKEKDSGR